EILDSNMGASDPDVSTFTNLTVDGVPFNFTAVTSSADDLGVNIWRGQPTCQVGPPALCEAPSGLVAWWTFDKPTGTDIEDIAGGFDNGTFSGGWRHVAGKQGWGAVSLNQGSVTIPSSTTDDLNLRTEYSFAAWIRMHSPILPVANGHFIASKGGSGGNSPGAGYDLRLNSTGKVFEVRLRDDSTPAKNGRFNFPILCDLDNGWHHVAVVMTHGTPTCPGGVILYIDGKFVTPSFIQAMPPGSFASVQPLRIGGSGVTNTDGDVDEVMIFQRALTELEVGKLYSDPDGLIASCSARPPT